MTFPSFDLTNTPSYKIWNINGTSTVASIVLDDNCAETHYVYLNNASTAYGLPVYLPANPVPGKKIAIFLFTLLGNSSYINIVPSGLFQGSPYIAANGITLGPGGKITLQYVPGMEISKYPYGGNNGNPWIIVDATSWTSSTTSNFSNINIGAGLITGAGSVSINPSPSANFRNIVPTNSFAVGWGNNLGSGSYAMALGAAQSVGSYSVGLGNGSAGRGRFGSLVWAPQQYGTQVTSNQIWNSPVTAQIRLTNSGGVTNGSLGPIPIGYTYLLRNIKVMANDTVTGDTATWYVSNEPAPILLSRGATQTISAVTRGNPTIVTTTSTYSGLTTGQSITITGVTGATWLNSTWVVTCTGTNTFTVPFDSSASAAWVSGGTWVPQCILSSVTFVAGPNTSASSGWTSSAFNGMGVPTMVVDNTNFAVNLTTGVPANANNTKWLATIDTMEWQ
jgi:hypothetical protein